MARVAIVGAGPAGSSAAWHLAKRGQQVDLIDRSVFPRAKTCGDWIPLNAVEELAALELGRIAADANAADCATITRTTIGAPGGRMSHATSRAPAFCMPRLTFDAILWRHAIDAGCRPIQRMVRDPAALNADYDVVIDARGAAAGAANAVALRAYWTVPRSVLAPGEEATVQIHTDTRFERGYGWMFPVGSDNGQVRMNVGVGLWADDSVRGHSVADFHDRFLATNAVLARWMPKSSRERPVGCHVGLGIGANPVAGAGVLRIGDAANLADPLTGDGIANALRSGRLVAGAVADSTDRRAAAVAWQARHDESFVPEFTRALRLQRLLAGTASKNLTSAILAIMPPLRSRVHAAVFGEMTYGEMMGTTRTT
ncbi:MAG TPA: NAD(P)/FAD-dependent oxidoreductase [Vicinamibacterales bacterium]|nr:NAD(P)/FAD-dependent oxidoreductase [Vicinamibacterales bacterium]